MSLKGKSLMVLTPMIDGAAAINYITSLIGLIFTATKAGIPISYHFVYKESLVTRARNRLVDNYMKTSTATHCVFIDADIGFEPLHVMAMLENEFDIAGAPCTKKSIRWDRIQQAIKMNPEKEFSADELEKIGGDFVLNFEPYSGTKRMELVEPQDMRNLGTGLLMIKRGVFETLRGGILADEWYESRSDPAALPGPTYDFFPSVVNKESREYESEDYGFCMLAKRAGFKIWLCPWVQTSHMGVNTFKSDLSVLAANGVSITG